MGSPHLQEEIIGSEEGKNNQEYGSLRKHFSFFNLENKQL